MQPSVRNRTKTASLLQAEIRKSEARDIWLVAGATSEIRLCNDYDVTQQSCRVWAHTVHHSVPKKKAAASGETFHTAASPARHPPWRKPKGRKSHNEEAIDECGIHRSGKKHCAR
jgi:hypothetical protein